MCRTLTSFVLLLGLTFATGCATPGAAYIRADRATKDAVTPYLQDYAATTQPADAASLNDLLDSWEKRVAAGEASLSP
jgi:hypothetical protein